MKEQSQEQDISEIVDAFILLKRIFEKDGKDSKILSIKLSEEAYCNLNIKFCGTKSYHYKHDSTEFQLESICGILIKN